MRRTCLVLLAGVAAGGAPFMARADEAWMSPATQKLCDSVADAAPPATDLPSPGQAARLRGCDAEALYYGIGRPADPVQARLCAFVQRQQAQASGEDMLGGFSGDAMLMTIYANGIGAHRDLRLAAHLACDIPSTRPEIDGRVPSLLSKLRTGWTGHDFSWCDDVTSGEEEGACAIHARRIAAAHRQAALDSYAAGLRGVAATRFADLRKAQEAWSGARSENEVDMSGSARNAFWADEQEKQDKDFAAMVTRLQAARRPRLGAAQLKAATARMDDILRRIHKADEETVYGWGTVSKDSIQEAQKAWLRYRDAWGAFAEAACPAWGKDAAEAWVTMKRADMLAAFLK